MPHDQSVQGLTQSLGIERATQALGTGDDVQRLRSSIDLFEKPEALLSKRERGGIAAVWAW